MIGLTLRSDGAPIQEGEAAASDSLALLDDGAQAQVTDAVAGARALHSAISTHREELPYLQKCAEATAVLATAISTSDEAGTRAPVAVLAALKEAVAVGVALERGAVPTIDWSDFDALVSHALGCRERDEPKWDAAPNSASVP